MDIGGQAVIEGVMMRAKKGLSTVVRKPDDELEIRSRPYISYSKRYKILSLPIFRGAVALIESLVLGLQELSYSAEAADPEENEKTNALYATLSMILAIVIGIGLFFALPYYLTGFIPVAKDKNPMVFNLVAGAIRIFFFLVYVYIISFMDDVKRLFQYHGAEHKTIACYEKGEKLTPKNAMKYSTLHARCGTSFILIAAISCILVFAIIDAIIGSFYVWYQQPAWYLRLAVHLPLIPIVSGISYEVLKLTGKYRNLPVVGWLALPGLGLQKLTTKEPDKQQLEVAIASLKAVLKI